MREPEIDTPALNRQTAGEREGPQVDPAILQGVLDELELVDGERARTVEISPTLHGGLESGADLGRIQILRERHVRMIDERLVETQAAGVEPGMHLFQFRHPGLDRDVNYLRDRE